MITTIIIQSQRAQVVEISLASTLSIFSPLYRVINGQNTISTINPENPVDSFVEMGPTKKTNGSLGNF